MAADVAGLVAGMDLLEPGFAATVPTARPGRAPALRRLRLDREGLEADPAIDAAVDGLVASAGLAAPDLRPTGWASAARDGSTILGSECDAIHGSFVRAHREAIGGDVVANFDHAASIGRQRLLQARAGRTRWAQEVAGWWDDTDAVVLPTLGVTAPPLGPGAARRMGTAWTLPPALAGLPALSLPVPLPGRRLPASVQLVGPPGSDALLCALGLLLEGAAGA
jgi:amidase